MPRYQPKCTITAQPKVADEMDMTSYSNFDEDEESNTKRSVTFKAFSKNNLEYYINIHIDDYAINKKENGTFSFKAKLDTGSEWLWIPKIGCYEKGKHHEFNISKSYNYTSLNTSVSLEFFNNSMASGIASQNLLNFTAMTKSKFYEDTVKDLS